MKKIFKKSLACLIAVLMIVSSLPFATLTASAATTTSTVNVTHYGVIFNNNGTRFSDPVLKICNDNENDNFTIGFINFDISGLSFTSSDTVLCDYTYGLAFASGCKDPSTQAVCAFYPTKNVSDFSVSVNDAVNKSSTDIYTSTTGTHVDRAKDYYGLTSLNADVEYANIDGNDKTVNIGPAIKAAKDAGRTEATVCFMFRSAGKTASNGGWSDTDLTVKNKSNISVSVSEATDYVVPSNLNADTANTSPKTFTASSYFGTAVVPGYQGNVIYCSKSVSLDEDTDNYLGKKMCVPKNTVMAYNGATDTYMPVFAGFYATTNSNVQMCYVTLNWGSNPFSIDSWTGYINKSLDNTAGILKDSPSELSVTKSETLLNYQSHDANRVSFVQGDHGNGDYYWWTKMKYTGTGNSDTYYDKYTNPVFQYGHRNEYWGWKNRTVNKTVSNTNVYVVNYKPVYDVLSNSRRVNSLGGNYTFKELYSKVFGRENYYTVSSLNKYYDAVSKLIAIDPQSYLADATDSDVESKVVELSSKIKAAYDNYISAAQGLVARPVFYFQRADGSQIAEVPADNESSAYTWGITENHVSTTPDTQKTSNGNGQHTWKTYSWPTSATNNVFKEIESEHTENCSGGTATCTAKAICSGCNTEYGDVLGHNYTYIYVDETYHTKKCTRCDSEEQEKHNLDSNGTCTLCNQKILDLEAWNKAAQESGSILVSGASVYTPESFNEYNELYKSAVEVRQNATTQAEVDKATAMLLSAQTVLRKKSVTVTLQKVGANDNPTTIKTYENQAYGTALEIDLATEDSTIKGVEKWTISTDDGATTTKLSSTDTKLTLYVTKSATVTVYELDEPTDSETVKYSKVVFLGKNGVIVGIRYVAENTELETNTVTVPQIPFYDNGEWDTTTVTGTGNTIYVRAKYTASTNEEDMCNVHFGEWSRKYSYDSFVRPEGIDPSKQYALASDAEGKNILTYLEGVDFYAPKTSNIYVVEVSERVAKTGITGHFAGSDDTHRWATYNCKFYLPKDCTAIEWGLEVKYGANTKIMKAESLSNGNEYTIIVRVKQGSTITNVSCRSYVTYKQGNETKTIYSDVAVDQAF